MDNLDQKMEFSTKRKELVNNWISNCDSKSSYILTFFGVVITIIFTSSTGVSIIEVLHYSKSASCNIPTFLNFLLFLISILFIVSAISTFIFTYLTLKARIDPKIYKQQDLITSSNIFYGTVCSKSFKEFNDEVKNESSEDYLNDLNSQIYINSNIANAKFKNYNLSLISMIVTFGLFLLFLLIK